MLKNTLQHIRGLITPHRCLTAMMCVVVCMLCACGSGNNKRVLAVSIPPQKWLLDSIVGDRYEVISMLSSDSNPETFEPSMRQLMELQSCQAYFTIGDIPFEISSLPKMRENFPSLSIINSTEGLDKITDSHASSAGESHDYSVDPHVWTSLVNARAIAAKMYDNVVALDPDGKDYYTARYKALDANLASLNDSVAKALRPIRGRAFVVWHPSLSYFARDYGLTQIGLETTGKETSVAQYKSRLENARQQNALIFFTQAEFDTREADSMAKELNLPTVKVSLMQPDIASQIRFLTHELTKAGN